MTDTVLTMQKRLRTGLDALNFFLADVRDGLGPYLAVYLLSVKGPVHGWDEGSIGVVMTVAGLCGLFSLIPAGILIDKIRAKRAVIAAAAVLITGCCTVLPFFSSFYFVMLTQAAANMAAGFFAPAIAGLSLGVVGPRMFSRRIGRNEAFNHAGNVFSALAAAVGAYFLGPVVVFWLMAMLTVFSVASLLLIPAKAVDIKASQGMAEQSEKPMRLRDMPSVPFLLPLALLLALFHLANAAMLPSVGQLLSRLVGAQHATSLMAVCIVAAQFVMIPVALLVAGKTDSWGRKPFFVAAFVFLGLRGLLYPLSDAPYWLLGVQLLDGIGAGILGALVPVVIADLMWGKGHFNAAQGAVAFVQGIGASCSALLAGKMIVSYGYSHAFWLLGALAFAGAVLALLFMPETAKRSLNPKA